MLAITRTRTPEDCVFALKTDCPTPQSIPRTLTVHSTPKTQQAFFTPRSFGSTSSADSDPFPELLPWEALFESHICEPSPVAVQSVPSDISKTEAGCVEESSHTVIDMSQLLDPTTLAFGFQPSCLDGLDDALLHSPLQAFAAVCWETATSDHGAQRSTETRENSGSPWCPNEEESTLDMEDALSPLYSAGRELPIQVPISASLLWSDDSDSDSDECRTFQDDYTPVATIHGNDSLMRVHPVGDFSPLEKEKGLFYRDLTASFGTFEPIFSLEKEEHIGQSPVPRVVPAPNTTNNKSVPKRIAAFCARFPARVVASATIVR